MNRTRWICVLAAFTLAASSVYGWCRYRVLAAPVVVVEAGPEKKADAPTTWPMFGGTPSRNMVNTIDKNIPTTWNAEDGKHKNIKWVASLGGSFAYGGPVVADGKVFMGTNIKGTKAVLLAFDQDAGKFLWKIMHEIPNDEIFKEARSVGLCSTPVVEGKFLYYVTPGCEIICADTKGKIVWGFDMMQKLKVVPYHLGNCSPVIVGDLVMLVTSNGVNEDGKVAAPKAPSFLAINKKTGIVAWQSNLPGASIIEGQWSNPTVAVVNGKTQVIFPGGDNFLYGMDPEKGDLIWKCNVGPIKKKKGEREADNYIISTPVVHGDRLYVGLGVYPDHHLPTRSSYFVCIDITKKGDVSPKNYDVKDPANKDSALVWAVGGLIDPPPPRGRQANFGRTISSAAVQDGLVYITEEQGYLHCFDAKTGVRHWEHDFKASVWGSPYCVDGKVYVGTHDGDVVIFEQDKVRKYYIEGKPVIPSKDNDKKLPSASMDDGEVGTPVVAGGVLYIATRSKLFAIAHGK